jgi:hypothetical protein
VGEVDPTYVRAPDTSIWHIKTYDGARYSLCGRFEFSVFSRLDTTRREPSRRCSHCVRVWQEMR